MSSTNSSEPSSPSHTDDAMEHATPSENMNDEEFVVEDVNDTMVRSPNTTTSSPVVPHLDLNSSAMFKKDKLRTPSKRAVPFSLQSPSQELYSKYIRLEQDFKDLQRAFDLVSNEKIVLEKVVKQKENAIEKTQIDLENYQDIYEKLKEKSRLQESEIRTLQNEKKIWEENAPMLSLHKSKNTDFKSRTIAQEDSLDTIIRLENEIKLKNVKISSLESEVHTLQVSIEKKDKGIENLEKQVFNLETKHDKAYQLECKNAELLLKFEKAQKEIKTLQEVTRMKTRSLEELNNQIESLKTTAEEYEEYKKKIASVTRENDRLKQEIRMAERSTQKKDKEINKLVNEKDFVPIKTLEGDKRYLHNELKKLQDQKYLLERTVQIQDKKLETQRQRFEALTQSLKDTKIDKLIKDAKRNPEIVQEKLKQMEEVETDGEDEMYPSVFVDLLIKNAEEMRKIASDRDYIIIEKDAVIETLDRKVDIMEKSKVSDHKVAKKKIAALQDQVAALQENLSNSELNFKQKENNLKREKFALKKSLNQTSGRPNTASALQ